MTGIHLGPVIGEMLKCDGEEKLKGDRDLLKGNRETLKGNVERFKGDTKAVLGFSMYCQRPRLTVGRYCLVDSFIRSFIHSFIHTYYCNYPYNNNDSANVHVAYMYTDRN